MKILKNNKFINNLLFIFILLSFFSSNEAIAQTPAEVSATVASASSVARQADGTYVVTLSCGSILFGSSSIYWWRVDTTPTPNGPISFQGDIADLSGIAGSSFGCTSSVSFNVGVLAPGSHSVYFAIAPLLRTVLYEGPIQFTVGSSPNINVSVGGQPLTINPWLPTQSVRGIDTNPAENYNGTLAVGDRVAVIGPNYNLYPTATSLSGTSVSYGQTGNIIGGPVLVFDTNRPTTSRWWFFNIRFDNGQTGWMVDDGTPTSSSAPNFGFLNNFLEISQNNSSAQSTTTTNFSGPPPTLNFTTQASNQISYNGQIDLLWSTTNATFCTKSGDWSGVLRDASGSESTGRLTSSKTFSLNCTGPGGVTPTQSIRIEVASASAPTIIFRGEPEVRPNGTVSSDFRSINLSTPATIYLSWGAQNSTSCSASGDWSGNKPLSGSEITAIINSNKTYNLTCVGPEGSSSVSVSVTIGGSQTSSSQSSSAQTTPAPVVTFSATPTTINSGQASTLTWAATNATSCTAGGGWVGSRPSSGVSSTFALNANTTFTLTCTGAGGTTQATPVTVNVNAPTPVIPDVSINADNTSVTSGSGTTIRWNATNASSGNSCTASGGSGSWAGARASSGTFQTGNLTSSQTYSIRCNGANGGVSPIVNTVVNVTTPQSCTSSANACGDTNTGTVVNGSCNATTPANPTGYGTACQSAANSCGMQNTGTRRCDGTCSATAPPNSSCPVVVPQSCTSSANSCGQTNTGTIVNGQCNATAPANPTGFGTSCTSSANSCGQTNTGTRQCDGSCSANTPPNSQCPAPVATACTSAENSCGQTSNGTIVGGVCNATVPANPANFGNSCQSAANSCGQRATGTIGCNGVCSAVTPSNSSCPVATTTSTTATTQAESCQSSTNACNLRGNGFIVNGSCNAVVPANPTGFGNSCQSDANVCGQRNRGTIQCNGACSASAPADSQCPSATSAAASAVSNISAPTLTFNVSNTSTNRGSSVELRWDAINADSCESSGDWSGARGTSGTLPTGNLTSSKRYSLTCFGRGGSVARTVNVNVTSSGSASGSTSSSGSSSASSQTNSTTGGTTSSGAGSSATSGGSNLSPTMIFVADRSNVPNEVRLSWSSTNASSCVASGGWNGSRGTSGNASIGVREDTTFTLACSGSGGQASRTLRIEMEALRQPATAQTNTTTQTSERPNTTNQVRPATQSNFVPRAPTAVPLSTVVREDSSGNTVALSSGGDSQVSPPVISLAASPIVAFNNPANIEWSVANAVKCSASGAWQGEKDVNGVEASTPLQEDVVYTLSCEGAGGEASRTVEVVVLKDEPAFTKIVGGFFEGISNRISSLFSSRKEESAQIVSENQNISNEGVINNVAEPETPNIPTIPDAISSNLPPQVILYVTPIVKVGTAASIEWNATNVDSCVASGAWSGGKAIKGVELTADLFEDSTYTINCFGKNGTTTATVTAVVFAQQESFVTKIQKNVSNGFNRILDIFRGN